MTQVAAQYHKHNACGLTFYTNTSAGTGKSGVLKWVRSVCGSEQHVIAQARDYTKNGEKRLYCLYALATREQIEKLIQKNNQLYEVMPEDRTHKVVFDVDLKGSDVKDPLQECKEAILKHFPEAQMQIGGSKGVVDGKTKYSYHIVLSNYIVDGSHLEHTARFKPLQ